MFRGGRYLSLDLGRLRTQSPLPEAAFQLGLERGIERSGLVLMADPTDRLTVL